jgi:glycosyltransferase involved in cell wall biosynthesis
MRFHVIGLPHTHVTQDYSACAFSMKVLNFCRMMKSRGHTVFLYAGEQNEAPCDEHIVCISEPDRVAHVGERHYTEAPWLPESRAWTIFNQNATAGVKRRHQQGDFVCIIGGTAHKPIHDALPEALVVEFGVGYGGCFAKHKVFESYAWLHLVYGARSMNNPTGVDGQWFDAVIPGYLEPEKFPFRAKKDDYFLYVGRLTDRKGYRIAQDVCENLGKRLILAGPGPHDGYGEFVGVVGPEERGKLMAGAIASFVPTIYVEPFGNVAIEAMACGTPVICTDWGAMTETVLDGVTGFRCRTFGEFKRAAQVAVNGTLDPHVIRQHAIDNYSLEVIGDKYERYFERLSHLWKDGWYEGRTLDVGTPIL